MEELELRNIWANYNSKLDNLLSINQSLLNEVTRMKAKSLLSKMKPLKKFGIIIGIPWVLLLDGLTYIGWQAGGISFVISIAIISIITKISIAIYVYHLVLLYQIDHSESVTIVQEKIGKLKKSELSGTRIAFLQLPFWTTFSLNLNLITEPDTIYLIFMSVIFVAFTFAAYWLFRNININNMDKKWMKFLFSGSEWDSMVKASDMLHQIEEYKNQG